MLGVDPNRPVRAFRGTDPAALRAMLGAEAFERMQRMRELHRHPRPLTGQEREVVRQAAAPLLRDLAAGGLAPPHIRDEAHEDRADQAVCAWIQGPGRTGTGIWVSLSAAPAEQVAELAEQFQNWAADELYEAGRSPEWPLCPLHPADPHRLTPEVRDGTAVWTCRGNDQVICDIGTFPGPRARGAVRLDGIAGRFGGVLASGGRGPADAAVAELFGVGDVVLEVGAGGGSPAAGAGAGSVPDFGQVTEHDSRIVAPGFVAMVAVCGGQRADLNEQVPGPGSERQVPYPPGGPG